MKEKNDFLFIKKMELEYENRIRIKFKPEPLKNDKLSMQVALAKTSSYYDYFLTKIRHKT